MKYFIIALIILAFIVLCFIIGNIITNKKIFKFLNSFNDRYQLIKAKRKSYDYVLRTEDLDIYLCVLKVPKHCEICINSKETWKLSYSFTKNDPGKAYSSFRYLNEIEYFLKNDIITKRPYLKVVFLYKRCDKIVRYLNETELDVIDITKSPYGYKITSFENFSADLDILLKKTIDNKEK